MTVNFHDVPKGWALCFMHHCKFKADCLRYLAAQSAPGSLTTGTAVFPSALSDKECSQYRKARQETLAWGFSHIFDKVTLNDYRAIRRRMEQHFGSRFVYYNYHRGFKKLSEADQQWIANLFKKYGYTDTLTFDHYQVSFIFP